MIFDFNTKNSGVVHGFFNDITRDEKLGVAGTFSIHINDNGKFKEYNRTVRIDADGNKFFTWNREKIMFDDFLCDSPEVFIKKVEDNNDRLYGDSLCRTLLKYGMDSLHVMIRKNPMDLYKVGDVVIGFDRELKSADDGSWVEYRFVPEYLHRPENNYKLQLIPADESVAMIYSRWDTYVDDMVSLFKHCKDLYRVVLGTKNVEDKAA